MFYEDVDLGWRLNLLGHRVRYVPGSVAFHKHHVTMKKFGNFRESYLLERNALLSMYKNYDDESLAACAARGHGAGRAPVGRAHGRRRRRALDLQRSPGRRRRRHGRDPEDGPDAARTRSTTSSSSCRRLLETRRDLQARASPQRPRAVPAVPRDHRAGVRHAVATWPRTRCCVEAFGIDEHFTRPAPHPRRHRASRCWSGWPGRRSGRGRSPRRSPPEHDVRLVSTAGAERTSPDFSVEYAAGTGLRGADRLGGRHHLPGLPARDGPVAQDQRQDHRRRHLRPDAPRAARAGARTSAPRAGSTRSTCTTHALNEQLRAGRLPPVRLGQAARLLARPAGRRRAASTPPSTTRTRPCDNLLAVVPFGIADTPPVQQQARHQGRRPGHRRRTTRSSSGAAASTTGSTR